MKKPTTLNDELANALYVAVVNPDLTWWDDLTPEMQDGWRRGAALLRQSGDAALREALRPYLSHLPGCEKVGNHTAELPACTCGFDSTLAAARQSGDAALDVDLLATAMGNRGLISYEVAIGAGWARHIAEEYARLAAAQPARPESET